MAYLEIKGYEKKFGKTEVLKGISFSVKKGEVLSVIGSSGSGKTTLLRCLNFLETPDEGEMVLDGETIFDAKSAKRFKESDLREKRLNFGLVFQSFNLFPQYTVMDNITLAPKLLLKERLKKAGGASYADAKAEIDREAEDLLRRTGLIEKRSSYPCELSGGQQQRVAIARALALKPKILCFDEPTSALDPELTGEVLKVIKELKTLNMTMIIVTHEMECARNISDSVIYMADGVIVERGTPEEIFGDPKNDATKNFLKNYLESNY